MRLFVSSPSDVAPERARVDAVAARLNSEFEGLVQIDVMRWETGFYTADRPFQEAIDEAVGHMHATDMVVCILWKRVGSELHPEKWRKPDGTPYESGTVLELETALQVSRECGGAPDVYLFRKDAPVTYDAASFEVERAQHLLLERVFRRWTESDAGHNVAGFQRFIDPDDFERQLELCLRQWLERHGIIRRTVWDRRLKGSPFRGLEAFEADHAAVFFGRESTIERAVAKFRQAEEAGTAFLLLLGASGAGKSSLLRAGLVPRILRPGMIPGVDLWRMVRLVSGTDPVRGLAFSLFSDEVLGQELAAGDFGEPELLAHCFAGGVEFTVPPIRAALQRAQRRRAEILGYQVLRPARLLIAVDQVERMFAEAETGGTEGFADILRALVEAELAAAIIALRSDTFAAFQRVPGFIGLLEGGGVAVSLLPPSEGELEDIVKKPIASCHPSLIFEMDAQGRSLADRLIGDAGGGDALPLMQMALQRLYDAEASRGDGVLRLADYAGIDAAVAETANEVLESVGSEARAELPAFLRALVADVVEDTTGTELPIIRYLARGPFERGRPFRTALINAFIAHRLLIAEEAAGQVLVRPTHEALIRTWPAALQIIRENGALIRICHTLEPIAADWAAASGVSKTDYLITSTALLAGAERLLASFDEDLSPVIHDYITSSLAADAVRKGAERRRHRRTLGATAAGLVIALLLAGFAGWQWRIAIAQEKQAEAQRARAEATLAAATNAANDLLSDIGMKFVNRGAPAAMIGGTLDRIRSLQDTLMSGGEASPSLQASEAMALEQRAVILLEILGDSKGALDAASKSRDIWQSLIASEPTNIDLSANKMRAQLSLADNVIGEALVAQGRLDDALAAYRRGVTITEALIRENPDDGPLRTSLNINKIGAGNVLQAQGHLDESLVLYRDALASARLLSTASNELAALGKQQVFLVEERLGMLLEAQGHLNEALATYRDMLSNSTALAQSDPGNATWRGYTLTSNYHIGAALKLQGHFDEALAALREMRADAEVLAQQDPDNTEWQRNLAVSNDTIGTLLQAQGQFDAALDAHRRALAVHERLAQKDQANTERQNELALSHMHVGDVFRARGRLDEALAAYRDSFAIRKRLAQQDPANANWQHSLSQSGQRIGSALEIQGKLDDALAMYREGLVISKALVRQFPDSTFWQFNLAVAYVNVGEILEAQGNVEEALTTFQGAITICKALFRQDSGNTEWLRLLSASNIHFGDVLLAQGRRDEARIAYREGLATARALSGQDPTNTAVQTNLAGGLLGAARAGLEPEKQLREALEILQKLEEAGALPIDKKVLIDKTKAEMQKYR